MLLLFSSSRHFFKRLESSLLVHQPENNFKILLPPFTYTFWPGGPRYSRFCLFMDLTLHIEYYLNLTPTYSIKPELAFRGFAIHNQIFQRGKPAYCLRNINTSSLYMSDVITDRPLWKKRFRRFWTLPGRRREWGWSWRRRIGRPLTGSARCRGCRRSGTICIPRTKKDSSY